ncbi:hypothetical protein BH10PSE7_BH10PSE7_03320 [soil metagenome]
MPKFSSISNSADSAIFASSRGEAVHAESSATTVAAVAGIQLDTTAASFGAGLFGECRGGGAGVVGRQVNAAAFGAGVAGDTAGSGSGVFGASVGSGDGVKGVQNNPTSTGAGIVGEHIGGLTAGFFKGNVIVTGDVSFPGADCAEEFTIQGDALAEPGTVMVLSETGELVACADAYDKKVAGVIAGAGSLRSGIIMGRQEDTGFRRQPIALIGTVYCKADARHEAIAVGDLLTSSATYGHAMKASDPARAFGAVIGKAMAPLSEGVGLIPILIALQ